MTKVKLSLYLEEGQDEWLKSKKGFTLSEWVREGVALMQDGKVPMFWDEILKKFPTESVEISGPF